LDFGYGDLSPSLFELLSYNYAERLWAARKSFMVIRRRVVVNLNEVHLSRVLRNYRLKIHTVRRYPARKSKQN